MEHANEIRAILEEKKYLNFQASSTYTEVEDSIFDLLKVSNILDSVISGDPNTPIYIRLLRLVEAQPEVVELINDVKTFVEQFLQLDRNTVQLAINGAYDKHVNAGRPVRGITKALLNGLWTLMRDYVHGKEAYEYIITSRDEKKTLLAGGDIFPPLVSGNTE